MGTDKNRKDSDKNSNNGDGCTRMIKKMVSVAALVKVKPSVSVEESDVVIECCGPLTVSKHKKKKRSKKDVCDFIVKQNICVRIPVHFEADAEVNPLGIICDPGRSC
jgi:hypothetical protein